MRVISTRRVAIALFIAAACIPALAAEEGVRSLELPSVLVEDDPKPLLGLDLPPASYPLEPIDQLPFYGAKHGFVATTTGNLAFGITDLKLPGRMPIVFGRVYDSKLSTSLPPPPPGGKLEARWTQDLGENWMLGYQAYLLSDGSGGFTMATPEGDLIEWAPAGGGYFLRAGGAPSRHMILRTNGPGSMVEEQWDGTSWIFTAGVMTGVDFALTKIMDRSGNFVQLNYSSGYLSQIINSDGEYVTINRPIFDPQHPPVSFPDERITSVSDSAGRTVAFDYSTSGHLTTVTDVMQEDWTYGYDVSDKLSSASDPLGNEFLSVTYSGARVATMEADEGEWTFYFDTSLLRTRAEDALGNEWTYWYDPSSGITTRVDEPTGANHEITLSTANDPIEYDGPLGMEASWTYDTFHRPLTYSPPWSTNTITYTYENVRGWVEAVTHVDGGVTTFVRDAAGHVLQETDPESGISKATYNASGDRLNLRLPEGVDAGDVGYLWTFGHDGNGDVTSVTDPTGRVFEFEYTATGEISKVRRPDHDDQGQTVTVEWVHTRDAAGRQTALTDPLQHTWTRTWDAAGRLVQIDGPEGSQTRYEYDARHRLTKIIVENGATDLETAFGYDAAGRLTTKTLNATAAWTYGYDDSGRMTSVTDPLSRQWVYGRDLAGRVQTITHPGGQVVTHYRDSAGRITSRVLPGSRTETFTYDAVTGRLTRAETDWVVEGWTGALEWDYDLNGRPTLVRTEVDDGITISQRDLALTYDLNGNRETLQSTTDLNGTPTTYELVTFSYDELDRLIGAVSDLNADWTVAYDPYRGHRTRLETTDQSTWEEWDYDAAGRLMAHRWSWPGQGTGNETYTRDDEDRLTSVLDVLTNTSRVTSYTASGRPATVEAYDTGVLQATTTFGYDELDQLVSKAIDDGQEVIESAVFQWDAAGRLSYARKDGLSRVFTWDDDPSFDHPGAALRVWRSPTTPDEPSAEILYGYDGRLHQVYAHELGQETPDMVADYRWAPVLPNRPIEATEAQSDGSLATRWLATGVGATYGELNASFGDTAIANPAALIDGAGRWTSPAIGSQYPQPSRPLSLGAWTGVFKARSGGGDTTALAGSLTGIIEGYRHTRSVISIERTAASMVSSVGEIEAVRADLVDDWSSTSLVVGRLEGDGRQAPAPGVTGGVSLLDEDEADCSLYWWCGRDVNYQLVDLCDYMDNIVDFAEGPAACGGIPFVIGGPGPVEPPLECGWEYDQDIGLPEPFRGADINEHGVSLLNGQFVQSATDLSVWDAGGAIDFTRTYRSGSVRESDLGYGWRHNYGEFIQEGDPNDPECGDLVRWVRPSGDFLEFYIDSSGQPSNPDEATYRIRRVTATNYEIQHIEGSVRSFVRHNDGIFRLDELRRGQNILSFDYDAQNRLQWIRSSTGAGVFDRIEIQYHPSHGRIQHVKDASGSYQVTYAYTACGQIESVTFPATQIGWRSNGTAISGTPQIEYAYQAVSGLDSCEPDDPASHLLTKITADQLDPVTEDPSVETIMTIVYDVDSPGGGSFPTYRRVIGQCFGASQCVSSYDIEYDYSVNLGNWSTHIIDKRPASGQVEERHEYGTDNKLQKIIEDVGGFDRTTVFFYTGQGLQYKVRYPDGRCRITEYASIAGVHLPTVERIQTEQKCSGGQEDQPDRIVYYRRYNPLTGRPSWEVDGRAFTTSTLPAPVDPLTDSNLNWFTTYYDYDIDQQDPTPEMLAYCQAWGIGCPANGVGDVNDYPGDDGNAYGNIVRRRVGNPQSDEWLTTTHEYTTSGRLRAAVGPDGIRTEQVYFRDAVGPWSLGDPTDGVEAGPLHSTRVVSTIASDDDLETAFEWSARARRTAVRDPAGNTSETLYSTTGQPLETRAGCTERQVGNASNGCDPAGETLRTTRMSYDLRGRLIVTEVHGQSVTTEPLRRSQSTYDDLGRLVASIADPGGLNLVSSYYYDDAGRLLKSVTPQSRAVCQDYDALGRPTVTTEAATWDSGQSACPAPTTGDVVTRTWYDAMNRVIASQSPTGYVTYEWYDEHGRPEFSSDGQPEGAFNPVCTSDCPPTAQQASWYRDSTYDTHGRVIRQRFFGDDGYNGSGYLSVGWWKYDEQGRVTETATAVTTSSTDSRVPDNVAQSMAATSDPATVLRTQYVRYDAFGRPSESEDAAERITTTIYDGFGRPRQSLLPANDSGLRDIFQSTYDEFGRATKRTVGEFDPEGTLHTRETETRYDQFGRAWKSIIAPGILDETTASILDPLSQITMTISHWDPDGTNDPYGDLDIVTHREYDIVGRLKKLHQRKGPDDWATTEIAYDDDGLTTWMKDAEGNVTEWYYDPLSRLDRMQYPEVENKRQTVKFSSYNALGQPLEVQYREDVGDASPRLVQTMQYDLRGRLEWRKGLAEQLGANPPVFAGSAHMAYAYDDLGRMLQAVDCSTIPTSTCAATDAVTVDVRYDSAGQVIQETQSLWMDAATVTHVIDVQYDPDGRRSALDFPAVPGESRYSVDYDWDDRGRLRSLATWSDPDDWQSNVAAVAEYTHLGGRVWDREYPQNGSVRRFYSYDAQLEPVSAYDAVGRPTLVATSEPGVNDPLAGYSYSYDALGRPMYEQRVHEENSGQAGAYRTRAYRHDRMVRLTEWAEGFLSASDIATNTANPVASIATKSNEEVWTLDALSNWESHRPNIGQVEPDSFSTNALNQLEKVDPRGEGIGDPAVDLLYDWLGQLRTDESRSQQYVWDYFGRLTEVRTDADPSTLVASYRYDAFNRRVRREVPSGTATPDTVMHYVYDGWRVIEERGVTGSAGSQVEVVRARFGYGQAFDELLWIDKDVARTAGGDPDPATGSVNGVLERLYVHQDRLGNIVAISEGATAAIAERFTYSAYGTVQAWWNPVWQGTGYNGPAKGRSKFGVDQLFAGQRLDFESGLIYSKNRFLDSQVGRFLRRDLLGYGDGPNLYSYVGGRVSIAIDPLGLAGQLAMDIGPGKGAKISAMGEGGALGLFGSLMRTGSSAAMGGGPPGGSCSGLGVNWRTCGERSEYLLDLANSPVFFENELAVAEGEAEEAGLGGFFDKAIEWHTSTQFIPAWQMQDMGAKWNDEIKRFEKNGRVVHDYATSLKSREIDTLGSVSKAVFQLAVYDWEDPLGGSHLLEAATLIPGVKLFKAARLATKTARAVKRAEAVADVGNSVYRVVEDGATKYVGITNNLERRAAEHLRRSGAIIDEVPGLGGLSRADARAAEQALIEGHGLQKNGGTLLNKINSISASNPIYPDAISRGQDLLNAAGYTF